MSSPLTLATFSAVGHRSRALNDHAGVDDGIFVTVRHCQRWINIFDIANIASKFAAAGCGGGGPAAGDASSIAKHAIQRRYEPSVR